MPALNRPSSAEIPSWIRDEFTVPYSVHYNAYGVTFTKTIDLGVEVLITGGSNSIGVKVNRSIVYASDKTELSHILEYIKQSKCLYFSYECAVKTGYTMEVIYNVTHNNVINTVSLKRDVCTACCDSSIVCSKELYCVYDYESAKEAITRFVEELNGISGLAAPQ